MGSPVVKKAQQAIPQQATPPAIPKALARAKQLKESLVFEGPVLSRCRERPFHNLVNKSTRMLRQHILEAQARKEGGAATPENSTSASHGTYVLTEADVLDAVRVQALAKNGASRELLCDVVRETDYESVRVEADLKLRFSSGVVPLSEERRK